MKNTIPTIILTLLILTLAGMTDPAAAKTADSLKFGPLGAKLEEYFKALERESIDAKCRETDFLIESCKDSSVRQFTALKIYSHYIGSKVMGDEGVAIAVYDKWFSSGKVKMKSEIDLLNARIFAEFNRRSLIGAKAPELTMEDYRGDIVPLFVQKPQRYSVLYFYDTDCSKCKIESILLRRLLSSKDYPINFYAIYTQGDREKWERYIRTTFDLPESKNLTIRHLWDPEIASDFQMKYGILQTPRLFLVSDGGIIVGRGLDCAALETLLDARFAQKDQFADLSYGSEESAMFYDAIFAKSEPDCESLKQICSHVCARTLEEKDTLLFRQMTGDLMYYLSGKRGEGVKCALQSLIENQIFAKPEIWKTPSDSVMLLSFAGILKDLLGKSPIGEKLADITVEGLLKQGDKEKEESLSLRKLRNCTVIFMTNSCAICKKEIAAADSLSKVSPKQKFFIVNVDELLAYKPEKARILFDNFDLTMLPYITQTDKKARVSRKYMSLL